ncbi:MAG: SIR2 family protein, partial [Planctomycetota bacterium]
MTPNVTDVTIELNQETAAKLADAFQRRDPKLARLLEPIVLKNVRVGPRVEELEALQVAARERSPRPDAPNSRDREESQEAFDLLECAFLTGRRVVPLFGAGISGDAGIPLIPTLREYLTRVENYIHIELDRQNSAGYLKDYGWPERHELNARFLSSRKREDLCRSTRPTGTWLEQLDRVTDGDETLRDLFFLQLTRGRRPGSCHNSVAFLAKLMNWPLILTTNFDSLIESALHEQGMQPTVYELTSQDKFPDPRLIVGNPAVVKLHGGAANLITGYMLKDRLRPESRKKLLGYFPENGPLLLALGYSGADERVMSFVREYCRCSDGRVSPRALWIHRSDSAPKTVQDIIARGGQMRTARYSDGDRFLQELYTRLTTTHPVSRVPYRVLAQVPPQTQWTIQTRDPDRDRASHYRVVVYHRDSAPYGTSTALAASDLETRFPTHRLIWCDMEEIPTVDSLIGYIQNEICRYDPEVPPFSLFHGGILAGRYPTAQGADDFERDARVTRLVEAIQRDKYLLVIDSMGEFGNCHVADFVNRLGEPAAFKQRGDQLVEELRRLRAFLLSLARRSQSFGETKLFIAHTYFKTGDPAKDEEIRRESDSFVSEVAGCPDAAEVRNPQPDDPPFLRREFAEHLTDKWKEKLEHIRNESLERQVSFLWEGLKESPYRVLLAVASAFRRPRSLVALRRLAAPFLPRLPKRQKSSVFTKWFFNMLEEDRSRIWDYNLTKNDRREVDSVLEELSSFGLLVRQEGGFFWMHRVVRDTISQCMLKEIRSFDSASREKALLGVGDL